MSFKQILIFILLIAFVGGGAAFFISNKNQVSKNSPETTSLSPAPTSTSLLTWTDEAGFTFQYPQGTQVDKHPEDTKNYANLTLTLPSSDTINIVMADNTYKNLNAWVGQKSAIDTSLGGKAAKKVIDNGQVTVACIDSEVLVTITGKDISKIVDSWTFLYPTPTTGITKTKTTTTTVIDDGGDVLEEE